MYLYKEHYLLLCCNEHQAAKTTKKKIPEDRLAWDTAGTPEKMKVVLSIIEKKIEN